MAGTDAEMARGGCFGWSILAGAVLALGSIAQAQPERDALEPLGQYAELFLDHPKVSGNLLVGLRWASPHGSFDPDNVRVQAAAAKVSGQVCVNVMSKDGRYTAENLYSIPSSTALAPRFKSETRYGDRLRGYPIDDVAVMIREARSCDTADVKAVTPATVTPADVPQGGVPRRELVAFVNADPDRVGVSLIDRDGRSVAGGGCQPAGNGVRIAYSAVCALTLPDGLPPAGLRLRLLVKERFKTVPTDYKLLLP